MAFVCRDPSALRRALDDLQAPLRAAQAADQAATSARDGSTATLGKPPAQKPEPRDAWQGRKGQAAAAAAAADAAADLQAVAALALAHRRATDAAAALPPPLRPAAAAAAANGAGGALPSGLARPTAVDAPPRTAALLDALRSPRAQAAAEAARAAGLLGVVTLEDVLEVLLSEQVRLLSEQVRLRLLLLLLLLPFSPLRAREYVPIKAVLFIMRRGVSKCVY
jgi:hypothetical protein